MERITEKQLSILAVSLIGLFASFFFSNYLPLVVSTIVVLIVEFTSDKTTQIDKRVGVGKRKGLRAYHNKNKEERKEKLWVRRLSCGHRRLTNIAFLCGVYDKPKIGDKAYCRTCWKEVKVVRIEEAKNSEVKFLKNVAREIHNK